LTSRRWPRRGIFRTEIHQRQSAAFVADDQPTAGKERDAIGVATRHRRVSHVRTRDVENFDAVRDGHAEDAAGHGGVDEQEVVVKGDARNRGYVIVIVGEEAAVVVVCFKKLFR